MASRSPCVAHGTRDMLPPRSVDQRPVRTVLAAPIYKEYTPIQGARKAAYQARWAGMDRESRRTRRKKGGIIELQEVEVSLPSCGRQMAGHSGGLLRKEPQFSSASCCLCKQKEQKISEVFRTMPGVRTGLNLYGSLRPSTFFLLWCRS